MNEIEKRLRDIQDAIERARAACRKAGLSERSAARRAPLPASTKPANDSFEKAANDAIAKNLAATNMELAKVRAELGELNRAAAAPPTIAIVPETQILAKQNEAAAQRQRRADLQLRFLKLSGEKARLEKLLNAPISKTTNGDPQTAADRVPSVDEATRWVDEAETRAQSVVTEGLLTPAQRVELAGRAAVLTETIRVYNTQLLAGSLSVPERRRLEEMQLEAMSILSRLQRA